MATFGEAVTVDGVAITAIFDHDYVEVQGVESRAPLVLAITSEVSAATYDDDVIVRGVTYQIKSIQNDGQGMTTLVLAKK